MLAASKMSANITVYCSTLPQAARVCVCLYKQLLCYLSVCLPWGGAVQILSLFQNSNCCTLLTFKWSTTSWSMLRAQLRDSLKGHENHFVVTGQENLSPRWAQQCSGSGRCPESCSWKPSQSPARGKDFKLKSPGKGEDNLKGTSLVWKLCFKNLRLGW